MLSRPLISTLFPYTTLFRSHALEQRSFTVLDLLEDRPGFLVTHEVDRFHLRIPRELAPDRVDLGGCRFHVHPHFELDRKSTRLNSSHQIISYAVFCLKKKKN